MGVIASASLSAKLSGLMSYKQPGRRILPASTGLVEVASQMVHYALYGLLISEVALGFLFRWAQTEPLSWFGLFNVPALFTFTRPQRHLIAETHNYVAITIMVFAGLHAAAALFHHFWIRDDVLWRMLPGLQARRQERASPDPRAIEGDAA